MSTPRPLAEREIGGTLSMYWRILILTRGWRTRMRGDGDVYVSEDVREGGHVSGGEDGSAGGT